MKRWRAGASASAVALLLTLALAPGAGATDVHTDTAVPTATVSENDEAQPQPTGGASSATATLNGSTTSSAQAEASAASGSAAAEGDKSTAPASSTPASAPDWNSFPAAQAQYPDAAKAAFDPDGDGKYVIGRPTAGGAGAGAIPAGLEAYYNQKVTWGSCQSFIGEDPSVAEEREDYDDFSYYTPGREFKCGYVTVPVDYSHPDGETMAVGVLRALPSPLAQVPGWFEINDTTPLGVAFANPGGPGQDSLEFAKNLALGGTSSRKNDPGVNALGWATGLLRYEVVGVSARGTRFSIPNIVCESVEANQAYEAADLTAAQSHDFNVWRAQQCATNSVRDVAGVDGQNFINHAGMDGTARDMDVVRAVLGAEKLNYYGVSYGSKLGYQYSQLFPGNLNNLVIDSSENQFQNNTQDLAAYKDKDFVPSTPLSRGWQQAAASEQTFRNYLRSCLEGGDGAYGVPFQLGSLNPGRHCPLNSEMNPIPKGHQASQAEVDAAYTKYQDITRKAVDNPHYFHTSDPNRPVRFDELIMGTLNAMYSESRWMSLAWALGDLVRDGDAERMLGLADDYYGRTWDAETGKYIYPAGSKSPGRFETLSCIDTNSEESSVEGQPNSENPVGEDLQHSAPWLWDGKEREQDETLADVDYCTLFKQSTKLAGGKELSGLPPLLVAGGTDDFATPFWNSVITADALNGYLLIVAQSSHGVLGSTRCATNLVNYYYKVGAQQFEADFKNGKFTTAEFTGAENVRTKNIKSEAIIGNECQLYSFRDGENGVVPPSTPAEPSGEPTDPSASVSSTPAEPSGKPTDPSASVSSTPAEPSGKPTDPSATASPTEVTQTTSPTSSGVSEQPGDGNDNEGAAHGGATVTPVAGAGDTHRAGRLAATGPAYARAAIVASGVLLALGVALRLRARRHKLMGEDRG